MRNVNDIFNKIISLLNDEIKKLENEKNIEQKKEKTENREELYQMIDYLEIFCNKLYKNNLNLFYFFTIKFTENFPYETKHKCVGYDENKNIVTFIRKDKEQKHICICPFLQVIIYALMKRKSKQNSQSFLIYFFKLIKIK